MFKTNLEFANLCLYNELDEILCCFIFCDVWELFCVSTRHQKLKKKKNNSSPKFFFCCSIYSLQHYAHHRKTHCCAFCQLRKLLSVGFTRKSTIDCVPLRLYPLCPKRHFLQRSRPLQSQTTALLLHTMFRLQERKV